MESLDYTKTPKAGRTICTKISHDDDTDLSPEPSPNGPPLPMQQNVQNNHHDNFKSMKWVPRPISSRSDPSTVPLIPDNRSSHSASPSSLFSGDEWTDEVNNENAFQSNPALEVDMNTVHQNNHSGNSRAVSRSGKIFNFGKSPNNMTDTLQKSNSSKHHSPFLAPHQTNTPSPANPAIIYLRQSLQESLQAQYLLKQENESLNLECDHFREEIAKWQTATSDVRNEAKENENMLMKNIYELTKRNKELCDEIEGLRQQGNNQNDDHSNKMCLLNEENRSLKAKVEELAIQKHETQKILGTQREETKKLSNELMMIRANSSVKEDLQKTQTAQLVRLEHEILDLRGKMKSQATEHIHVVNKLNTDHESKVASLSKENASAGFEIMKLQAMLRENKIIEKQLNAEKEKSKELETLAGETTELKKRNAHLEEELKKMEEVNEVHKGTIESTRIELMTTIDSLKAEVSDLNMQLEKAEAGDKETKLKSREVEVETNRLQLELALSIEKVNQLIEEKRSLEKSSRDSNLKSCEMSKEFEKIVTELEERKVSKNQSCGELLQLQDMVQTLCAELTQARSQKQSMQMSMGSFTKKLEEVESKNTHLQADLVLFQNEKRQTNAVDIACQTDHSEWFDMDVSLDDTFTGGASPNSVANRFMRVKDSAERSAIIMEYKQELAKVKKDYENEIQFLAATHQHQLKEILVEAKQELKSKISDNKKSVSVEVQKLASKFQLKHQAELEKLKHDFHLSAAKAEEELQSALSEITSCSKKLEEQLVVRDKLERSVRNLQRKLEAEEKKTKANEKLLQERKVWQEETNRLIASIQDGCNSVFVKKLKEPFNQISPKSVFLSEEDEVIFYNENSHALHSPTQVNKTLDETEAFVLSIIGED